MILGRRAFTMICGPSHYCGLLMTRWPGADASAVARGRLAPLSVGRRSPPLLAPRCRERAVGQDGGPRGRRTRL